MTDDEDWITEDMDDYFLGTPEEPEYVDPDDYSYVDSETGLTPKQQAYQDYLDYLRQSRQVGSRNNSHTVHG